MNDDFYAQKKLKQYLGAASRSDMLSENLKEEAANKLKDILDAEKNLTRQFSYGFAFIGHCVHTGEIWDIQKAYRKEQNGKRKH